MRRNGGERSGPPSEGEAEWSTVLDAPNPQDPVEETDAGTNIKGGLSEASAPKVLVSRYVLIERIGAGALGVVYSAYDPQLDRKVAVKLVKAGLRGHGQERVQREARALAKLAHPNVITVHDVGTHGAGDSVFIVMELVDGTDLRVWAKERRRPRAKVLDAFIAAGRGLIAAHQAGLVHRDFKPANVLIGHDGRVRVVDFGLARPGPDSVGSGEDSPEHTHGLHGTPAYMAPEQHAGKPVDARADQYAFCVSLFEALHGERPFSGDSVEHVRLAKERGVLPTTALPQRLRRVLERGLEPRPEDRFASMEQLLRELVRVRKRRRWWAIGAAVAGAGIVAAITGQPEPPCREAGPLREQVWGAAVRHELGDRFAASEVGYAAHTWETVDALVDAYLEGWVEARTEACEATLLHNAAGIAEMNRRFRCLDRGLEAVDALSGVLSRSEPGTIEHAVTLAEQLPPLDACAQADPEHAPARNDAAPAERAIARAQALLGAGLLDEALKATEEAVRITRDVGIGPLEVEALRVQAQTQLQARDLDAATTSYYAALERAEEIDDDAQGSRCFLGLAAIGIHRGNFDQARAWIRVATAKARDRADPLFALDRLRQTAIIEVDRGDANAAVVAAQGLVEATREALGKDHTRYGQALSVEGRALELRGDYPGSRKRFTEALGTYERRLGPNHPSTAQALVNLAARVDADGEHDAALEAYARARGVTVAAYGETHTLVGHIDANVAATLAEMGRIDEAITKLESATTLLGAAGNDRPDYGKSLSNLASLELDAGRLGAASEHAERAVAVLEGSLGRDNPTTAVATINLARTWAAQGRLEEAKATVAQARRVLAATIGEDHPQVAELDQLSAEWN